MSYLEAILYGIVQGITEFLPISSTAHIILAGLLTGQAFPGLSFEIFLHLASVLAVIGYFRKDLIRLGVGATRFCLSRDASQRPAFYFVLYLMVATVITGVLGVALNSAMGDHLKHPRVIGTSLVATGLVLIFIEKLHGYGTRLEGAMRLRDAIWIGLGQTIAVLPGVSRSGATLATALLCGLERETAVRFSFLLAIPVILGSSVLGLLQADLEWYREVGIGPLLVSFVASLVFSVIGIVWLIAFLKKSRLFFFAIYLFVVGTAVFLFLDPAAVEH